MADINGEDALEWLRSVPGYRELIKARVSEARKRRFTMDARMLRLELGDQLYEVLGQRLNNQSTWRPKDMDKIGREVDGCG